MQATPDQTPRRISAAGLTVPGKAPLATPARSKTEVSTTFERLCRLDRDCGPDTNKHDRVIVLIIACIEEGLTTQSQIIGTLTRLGFNNRHVAIQLKSNCGTVPGLHRWRKETNATYALLS